MPSITLTAKRQATFPVETCRELGLRTGDTVQLDAVVINGERVWLLRPRPARERAWAGALSGYGVNKRDHAMDAIRRSVAKGRKAEGGK